MPGTILNTAGTYTLSTTPATLRNVFANGGSAGKISIYDHAGTAAPGTATLAWENTFSAVDVVAGKGINYPAANGLIAVLASNQQCAINWDAQGRRGA